jgi:hypothetical protein
MCLAQKLFRSDVGPIDEVDLRPEQIYRSVKRCQIRIANQHLRFGPNTAVQIRQQARASVATSQAENRPTPRIRECGVQVFGTGRVGASQVEMIPVVYTNLNVQTPRFEQGDRHRQEMFVGCAQLRGRADDANLIARLKIHRVAPKTVGLDLTVMAITDLANQRRGVTGRFRQIASPSPAYPYVVFVCNVMTTMPIARLTLATSWALNSHLYPETIQP